MTIQPDMASKPNGLGSVITNSDISLPCCPETGGVIWDKRAIMHRLSAACYRTLGPRGTSRLLADAMGRQSDSLAKQILARQSTPSLPAFVRLYHQPGFGEPFFRRVMGLPDNPDKEGLIRELQEIIAGLEQL